MTIETQEPEPTNVLVVSTHQEAHQLGARQRAGEWRMPDGTLVLSVVSAIWRLRGSRLRIGELDATRRAAERPNFDKVWRTLKFLQAKTKAERALRYVQSKAERS